LTLYLFTSFLLTDVAASFAVETGGIFMILNYIKIALRNFRKNKIYTFINISGLAIGICSFILIALWVHDEWNFDTHHHNASRIFRVVYDFESRHGTQKFARTAPLYAPTLKKDFPEVESAVRFKTYSGVMTYGEKVFYENDMMITEPAALSMFNFEVISGDPHRALSQPKSIILTESMARKYFGNENPLGKIIMLDDTLDCTVTAVMADLPTSTHMTFNCLLSWETWRLLTPDKWLKTWRSNIYYTYIMLDKNSSVEQLLKKLPAFAEYYFDDDQYSKHIIHLQPLSDIHLYSNRRQEMAANGDIASVYIFSLAALLILTIACINFMNLSTARSVRRRKEVGLRKVIGADRRNLIYQFLGESILISIFASILALLMVDLILPLFNNLSGKTISLIRILTPGHLTTFLLLVLVVGLAAGSYPALLLSGFRPVQLFKTGSEKGSPGGIFQRVLIIFQFAISISLIICTIVISGQLDYLRAQHLGFEKEQLIVLPFGWDRQIQQQIDPMKVKLLTQNGILNVTASGDVPGHMATTLSYWAEGMANDEQSAIVTLIVDPDFLGTYQIDLLAGRDYSMERMTDLQEGVILNEKTVDELGWASAEAAIGKRFKLQRMDGRVIGVVRNFNFNSLHQPIEPLAMAVWQDWFGYLTIRIESKNISGKIESIEKVWTEFHPNRPFRYYFLNEQFDQQYRAEERMHQLFSLFSALAILIACLGLFGLVAYIVEQRTQEIAVRKVLGAVVHEIVLLLSKDFLKSILLANLIAWPLTWIVMNRWLQNFAYQTDMNWMIFVLVGGLILIIAMLTISMQTVRAAVADPVEALRDE
jgi:putative ABC transport system permease protein